MALSAMSQERKILNGLMLDKITNKEVRMASVSNITTGTTGVSRFNGVFEVEAAPGHILAFSANGFYADTVSVQKAWFDEGTIVLFIRPLPSTLTNVVVVGNLNAYQIDSTERRKSFLQDVGERQLPAISKATDLGFGVGINIRRWSKKEKRERKARTIYNIMEENAYVNYRWNEELLMKYTTYNQDDLVGFMERNRPEYGWLRKHTDEESLIYYINSSLKKENKDKK
jgi:hypothetical protein